MEKFHGDLEDLYGKKFMTFNVHTLRHIMKFIDFFGGPWSWSAYPFEHHNSVTKVFWHGTQCVPDQICRSYLRLREVKKYSKIFDVDNCSEKAKDLFKYYMNDCKIKNCINYDNGTKLFGNPGYDLEEIRKVVLGIFLGEETFNL